MNKNNTPKISVCLPTYNKANYIGEAIESALNQTFKEFELIILDDGSTDNTGKIISKFKDPRIKYHRNDKNTGMTQAWNKALSFASGKYITILHHDDRYSPKMLETESKFLDGNPDVGLVHSACSIIDEKGSLRWLHKYKEFKNYGLFKTAKAKKTHVVDGHEFMKDIIMDCFIRFPTVMVRRECYEKLGNYKKEFVLGADWNMWMRIALHPYKIGYIDEPLASWRRHSKNTTASLVSSGEARIDDYRVVIDILKEAAPKHVFTKREERKVIKKMVRDLLKDRIERVLALMKKRKFKEAKKDWAVLKKWKKEYTIKYGIMDMLAALLSIKL
ncbi:glycosyltransferase [Candidatus Margulisiibacteriota bacterium]